VKKIKEILVQTVNQYQPINEVVDWMHLACESEAFEQA
jgi:hypothetical protein